MSLSSSSTLARVHGHWGWVNITNVARSGAGLMRLSLGQRLGAAAAKPGAFSYDQRIDRPAPTATDQSRIADSNAKRPVVDLTGWAFRCTSFLNNFIGLDGERLTAGG